MPMLLSNQQKEILRLLRTFGKMKAEQVQQLLAFRFPPESFRLEPMLRQLHYGGLIRRDGRYVALPGSRPKDPAMGDALDIMLLLAPGGVQAFHTGTPPFILTFFRDRGNKLYRYDICPVSLIRLPVVCAQLEGIRSKYRVVILQLLDMGLKDICRAAHLDIPCEYCFALKTDEGVRFYKKERMK